VCRPAARLVVDVDDNVVWSRRIQASIPTSPNPPLLRLEALQSQFRLAKKCGIGGYIALTAHRLVHPIHQHQMPPLECLSIGSGCPALQRLSPQTRSQTLHLQGQ